MTSFSTWGSPHPHPRHPISAQRKLDDSVSSCPLGFPPLPAWLVKSSISFFMHISKRLECKNMMLESSSAQAFCRRHWQVPYWDIVCERPDWLVPSPSPGSAISCSPPLSLTLAWESESLTEASGCETAQSLPQEGIETLGLAM